MWVFFFRKVCLHGIIKAPTVLIWRHNQSRFGLRYYAVGERKKDRVITRGLIDPPLIIGKSKWNLTTFTRKF